MNTLRAGQPVGGNCSTRRRVGAFAFPRIAGGYNVVPPGPRPIVASVGPRRRGFFVRLLLSLSTLPDTWSEGLASTGPRRRECVYSMGNWR